MSQPRRTKIVLAVVGTLFAIPAIALILLLNYDWNRARPQLSASMGEAIGRPFAINGPLSLTWEKAGTITSAQNTNWRDFIPWPHLVAKDVHVGNPTTMAATTNDASRPNELASIGEISISLNPLALLDKTIAIPLLRFATPVINLRRTADGLNNWTLDNKNKVSPWELKVQRVAFSKGSIHLSDAIKHADITADVDTIDADPTYGVAWTLRGTYNGERITGAGKAGAVLSLRQQTAPFPIAANVKMGATSINIDGTLTKPTDLASLDMRLKVSGNSMARLFALTGLLLPETPHFSTEGHLLGTLNAQGSHWTYENFSGKVGSSDIGGSLDYQSRLPRGLLTGAVSSRRLQWSDMGPMIGADSNSSKAARGVAVAQPQGKVLPVERFKTERWTSIDADVTYHAEQIIRNKSLPISKLSTHLILKDGVIELSPLNFVVGGGTLVSNVTLDGSGRIDKDAIRAKLKATARHLKIKQLFPEFETLQASVGEINGDASLSATGNSVAGMLGSSNGEVKSLIDQGTVSKLLLEEMGLNVGSVVLTRLFGDKQIKLNCMASDFVVNKGVMQARTFIIDTDTAIVHVTGSIDLSQEQMNLALKPDSKGLRVFSLRAPLYLRGNFINPRVSVDKGVLAMRAGGAVLLAAVAPIAALIPLINTGPGASNECAQLLANARVKPLAPPPGTAMHAKPESAANRR